MADRRQNNDHDLLIRVDQKVESLTQKVDGFINNQDKRIGDLEIDHVTRKEHEDHEKRIRFGEKYIWGAIAIIGLLQLIGVAFIINLINK